MVSPTSKNNPEVHFRSFTTVASCIQKWQTSWEKCGPLLNLTKGTNKHNPKPDHKICTIILKNMGLGSNKNLKCKKKQACNNMNKIPRILTMRQNQPVIVNQGVRVLLVHEKHLWPTFWNWPSLGYLDFKASSQKCRMSSGVRVVLLYSSAFIWEYMVVQNLIPSCINNHFQCFFNFPF